MKGSNYAKVVQTVLFLCLSIFIISCTSKDDEGNTGDPIEITVLDLSVDETNEDKNHFIRLQLSSPSSQLITAYISTSEVTAASNSDFISFSNIPVVFEPGDLNEDYQIQIKGDEDFEEDETFEVTIVNVEGDATIDKASATITILNDDPSPDVIVIPSTGYTTPDSYPNLTLIWQDEFDGPTVDLGYWTFQLGGEPQWGNNELQYYRKENTQIHEGHLVITARDENFGGRSYTSSRMITKDKFDFKYGRVDIRAALPTGQGLWPALWMLGSNFSEVGWPSCGEIDIMEIIGSEPATLHGTAHWDNNGQHAQFGGATTLSSGSFKDEFHVFSIVWDNTKIRWLLDDVEFHVISTTPSGLSEFQQNFYFIFNVAVGGNWPGSPNSSTVFPQRMIVDYVRVFQ